MKDQKTMKVSLKQAFSILDGRLSTTTEDVYSMLGFVFDDNLMTHQLPTALRKVKEINPDWFKKGVGIINDIKRTNNTNDFDKIMRLIDAGFPDYQIELGKINHTIPFLAGIAEKKTA